MMLDHVIFTEIVQKPKSQKSKVSHCHKYLFFFSFGSPFFLLECQHFSVVFFDTFPFVKLFCGIAVVL